MRSKQLVLWLVASLFLIACGGGGGVDTVDRAALKDGDSVTRTLKFWMKGSGAQGDAIVDNVHFDDGANKRLVFWFDAALKDKVAALEQGKAYKVTFTHKPGDDLFWGTMTAVE